MMTWKLHREASRCVPIPREFRMLRLRKMLMGYVRVATCIKLVTSLPWNLVHNEVDLRVRYRYPFCKFCRSGWRARHVTGLLQRLRRIWGVESRRRSGLCWQRQRWRRWRRRPSRDQIFNIPVCLCSNAPFVSGAQFFRNWKWVASKQCACANEKIITSFFRRRLLRRLHTEQLTQW